MDEAKKTNQIRGQDFANKYLTGKVIDIGAGNDLVSEGAERFDRDNGDANYITQYRESNYYDTVHSSHCLEHMHEPKNALLEWCKLIKSGGYLVIVVPDEDLYEQGFWPSRFNSDHKATFTTKTGKSWSPVSYNIVDLVTSLPNSKVLSVEIHDKYYDYNLQTKYPPPEIKILSLYWKARFKIAKKISRLPTVGPSGLRKMENQLFISHHIPIDQTRREALAQIQVVVRKK